MSGDFVARFADQTQDVLKAILDKSQDCIKLLSLSGEVEYVNHNGCQALAGGDFAALTSRSWADIWPDDSRPKLDAALARAVRGERGRFEGYCPGADGEPRWWDVELSPVMNGDGKMTHVLAISRDITVSMQERMQDRMRRETAEAEAERSDNVAREMRHRLKNLLAVVSSVAKLISRHATSPREVIDRLEIKLQNLAHAQDLLTISRDQPVNAAVAIQQVLDASGAGEKVTVAALPDARLGDDAIQQLALILGELQTNSLKYGALGSDAGQITLSATLQDAVMCLHWHEDTGAPMSPPEKEGSGFLLMQRLGSTSNHRAKIHWHDNGPAFDFYIRVVS
ncbi:PAS domain-containing protein [Qipengyuania marisflavi]|uniref:histidine kinase n=1 Tax=Qipengyuania marisflavi TaxID=2486356 RepID=A0A5S3P0I8_9SPHN|nr:PAS domain-containing protein [Qipengyuania marisflavi]TMM46136.1 PAS domain S-box protein [Qipengyuania marisflavi]